MKKEEKIGNVEASMTPPLVPRKRKKKKWPIVILFLLIIGGVVFFFRQPILMGLSKVPVIGTFIPVPDENTKEELSEDELRVKVNVQEQEIEQLNTKIATLEAANQALTEKNKSLAQYETMYTDFIEQKAAWDEEVASTDPELFIEQFETVYPEVAERIYQGLKGEKILSDQQKKLSATIAQMDEDQAAAALELLVSTDSELVQSIFDGMNTDRKALILSAMSSQSAAQVIKLISPDKS
ncbi:MAG: hypothetical protein E7231_00710 [Cellulosilyticum sp.]|nr:hypothetical protein [Cellulosilyticum sp.]